ncbi:MAG: insulinase family protein [Holosporaceae bacterium]|nr:insulinase family protein [Holosporaceae bacterium]
MKIIITVILIVLISAPIFLKKEKQFIKIFESANSYGVKAYQVRVKSDKVVYVKCKFKNAGVLHNIQEKHGISAIVGTIICRKIGELSPEETEEKLNELGVGHFNINAFGDDFELSFFVLKDKAADALKSLSPIFSKPIFSKNDLEFVKGRYPAILDPEISPPKELLFDKMMNMLYPHNGYGLNNTGTAQAINSITKDDIDDFIHNNFSKDNLEVFFAGDVSQSEIELYIETLFDGLREKGEEKSQNLDISASHPSEDNFSVIYKKNMGNAIGIATGIRLDNLSNKEKATAYIILKNSFDGKIGDFQAGLRSQNIAYSVDSGYLQRQLSNVFYFFIFIDKKDLEKYKKYAEEKISTYQYKLNLKDLSFFQDSIAISLRNGFTSIAHIDKQIEYNLLPFSEITQNDILEVARKIFDKSSIRTVYIMAD